MRKLLIVVTFLGATTAMACSFSVGGKSDPQSPQTTGTAAPAVTTATTTTAPTAPQTVTPTVGSAGGRVTSFGKRGGATPVPGATTTTAPAASTVPGTAATAAPAGIPLMTGANAFGSGTPDPSGGWKGTLYMLPSGTSKLPQLGTMQPAGLLFAKQLDVASRAMTGGFPGIDPTRNEDFAIRWEGAILVENESDYDIRILSDDGAIVSIDGMVIVDNDGAHDAKDRTGPVHLVKGTHVVTVDYFQTKGNVALQLFCKKHGAAEQICPNRL